MNEWMMPSLLLGQDRTVYRLNRLQLLSEGWHWLVMFGVLALIVTYVLIMYRRDSQDLSRGVRWSLVVLRVSAFAAILFFFLDLERGVERKLIKDSRVAVLVDVSQSMARQDPDPISGAAGLSRIDHVVAALADSPLLRDLREDHAVSIYRFGSSAIPELLTSLPKKKQVVAGSSEDESKTRAVAEGRARNTAYVGFGLLAVTLFSGIVYLLFGRGAKQGQGASWALLVAMVAAIAAVVILAVASLRVPHTNVLALMGWLPAPQLEAKQDENQTDESETSSVVYWDLDKWRLELNPQADETRLGDAIKALVQQEQGGPFAGIVILTDGGSNAGSSLDLAATTAQDARIRLFPVGVGSTFQPRDVRAVDLEAPQRVYPGDSFRLKGYLQAFGLDGRSLDVDLFMRPANDDDAEAVLVDTRVVEIVGDAATVPVEFETDPPDGGKWIYILEVTPPAGVVKKPDESDGNVETRYRRFAHVEVVIDESKVLLIAGGATREYRFLRNALHRDPDVSLHVLLQTAEPGTAQEGDELLLEFPDDTETFFDYDCIVAFDPDWLAFNESDIRLLERWVAEKAGGLIVVSGPVFTPEWSQMSRGADPRVDLLKGLYPVQFIGEGSAVLTVGKVGGNVAWPLQFSRDGQSSKFLWLKDESIASEQAWADFDGVYGYFAVRDSKQGATVYARFSDPNETSLDNRLPIYLAGQFYGSGRVFFQASGEMWRLRALDPEYFAQYYTKLIRWVSQGRLLRDSSRGVLLIDKERCFVGDIITVSAVLTDAQFRPLTDETVEAQLISPDESSTTLTLRALKDSAREGEYQTQFTVTANGDYQIQLAPPESRLEEVLSAAIVVTSSKAETQDPLLNESDLQMLANRTSGQYFADGLAAAGGAGDNHLVSAISPNDQETVMSGSPDRRFKEMLMGWLMALLVGVLSMEWLIRRLSKLA
jgi:hypothetical protein